MSVTIRTEFRGVSVLFFLLIFLTAGNLYSEDSPGKLSGKSYFEYFLPQNSDGGIEKFQFTRFYFAYDYKLSEDFSVRYRLDGDRKVDSEKWRPFLKHAYVAWANFMPSSKIYIGMQGTQNWSYSEKFWGYRSVEKTIQDKHKIGTSADLGLGVKGKLSSILGYHIMYANGSGYGKPESDKYKKIYSLIAFQPNKNFIASALFDYEPKSTSHSNSTVTLFGGYEVELFKIGVEYFIRENGAEANVEKTGLSVFGRVALGKGGVFARFDSFDPDGGVSDDEDSYVILGYDYQAHKKFHVMPNVRTLKTGNEDSVKSFYLNFEFKF